MSPSSGGLLLDISTEKVGMDEDGGPAAPETAGPTELYERLPLLAELGPPLLRSGGLSALASEARERFSAPARNGGQLGSV